MTRFFFCVALLAIPYGLAHAQAPGASTIQLAMNEGLELEFSYFQELANVQILRGGATDVDEYLFLCTADLAWKLSSVEFSAMMQQEISEEASPEDQDDTLWRALNVVLADKLARIGEFASGDTIMTVRFRVRLERAGADWIVTDAKIRESDQNPLSIIDEGSR